MKRLAVIGVLMSFALPALAGAYMMNDTGQPVYGLRVSFAEPVSLTGFGDALLTVQPTGSSTDFVFSGGSLEPWGAHWFNWEPATAALQSFEWLSETAPANVDGGMRGLARWPAGTEYKQVGAPVGDYSYGLTYVDGFLWMADRTSGHLLKIDPTDGSALAACPVSSQLTGVTYDGTHIWTCSESADLLLRVDAASGEIVTRLDAPGSQPAGLAWDGEALWCVDRGLDALFRVDPVDGSVMDQIPAITTPEDSVFDTPRSFRGLMWNSGSLYLVDSSRRRIYQIDPDDGAVLSQITTPTGYPRGIATDGERFWYTDRKLGLHELEVETGKGAPYILSNPTEWRIRYHLARTNRGDETAGNLRIYVGEPQDLEHQEVMSVRHSPEPTRYVEDVFGQRIAEFQFPSVSPGTTVTIDSEYEVRLWQINYTIEPSEVGALSDIPFNVRSLYLIDGDKYDITNPIVLAALDEAVGDETNPYLMAVAIHDYVAEEVTYGSGPDGWAAAPLVLEAGEGSCSESTFSVVSMARAAGLPARYQGGTAPRDDGVDTDGHRWAEIYIPGYGWVPFDATRDDDDGEARHWYVASRPVMLTLVRGGGTDRFLYHTYRDWGKWSGDGASMDRDWYFEWEALN